jgi:gluconolactonase
MRSLTTLLALLLVGTAWAESKLLETEPAVFEKVATGFRFTEGPAADAQGDVYFTDIPSQRIHKFDCRTGKTTVFREKSGRANGLMFDGQGRLTACEGGGRRLVRIEGKVTTVLAERWNGKRLNSPNDLAIDKAGGIWFTDPRYGKQDDRELEVMAVYYLSAKGKLTQVVTDLPRPNGILLSADAKTLYVAANSRQLIMAYDVENPGVPSKGRVFATLDTQARGGPDGMTLDSLGNIYCAGQGHIWIWNPEGKVVHKLKVPEGPANCAFGGPKHNTLYVTARTSLYRLVLKVKGGGPVKPPAKKSAPAPKAGR